MKKDKLILTDDTTIVLETSQGISALTVNAENKSAACALWEQFTPENLKNVTIKNSDDLTIGEYPNMVLDHITGTDNADGTVRITFSLRSKSTEELLTERVDALESGYQIHNGAIGDTAQAISDIMEGGVQ